MPKIIHAADLHLDSPFSGLSLEKARQRRRESRLILDKLGRLVKEEQADLVLLAGDLFDGERVYPETLEALDRALASMDCPVFIAPGNHDPFTPLSPYACRTWPDNVYIFREPRLTAVDLPGRNCVVWGGAFTASEQREMLLTGFSAPGDGKVHLLCLHGDVDMPQSPYGPLSSRQIADSGLDYLALGHVHRCSGLRKEGGSFWAYPGCTEGRGFDELGEKGVYVGTVEKGSTQLRFVPLCARQCRILTVDVTDADPIRAVERAIPPDAQGDVCRLVLTGQVGERGLDLQGLEERFAPCFFALQLRDETSVARDIWDRAGEDSLRGLFLREMREQYEQAAGEAQREQITLAVRFGLAAMDGRDIG